MNAVSDLETSPALSVKGLSKTFKLGRDQRVIAADDVSFAIHHGEALGLVGASGAGKSTIARMAMGLVTPDAGVIHVNGVPLGRSKASQRRPQFVMQDPYASLSPRLRVVDLVAEPLLIQGIGDKASRRRAVIGALDDVALRPSERYLERFTHELSGGERQRVAFARAIVTDHPVIVADEPTAMLDVSIRRELVDLMRALRTKRGVAWLLITHDLAMATSFCDRIAVLDEGRIVEERAASVIFADPHHRATTALAQAARPNERIQVGNQ